MGKIPSVSERELIKWCKILGTYRLKELYFENKIQLTKEQLDKLIELGKEEENEGKKK